RAGGAGASDRVATAGVARGDGEDHAGSRGVVDGDAERIVRTAAGAQAQVRHVDAVARVAVAVRVDGALDRREDVRLRAAAARVQDLERHQRRLRGHANERVGVAGGDPGHVRAVEVVVHRIAVFGDEV